MKFEYTVKLNGRKYYPGEEVPLESENTATSDKKGVAVIVEEPKAKADLDAKKKKATKKDSKA